MVPLDKKGYHPSLRGAGGSAGYCYFCKTCGDVWYKLDFYPPGDSRINRSGYLTVNIPCLAHGTRYSPGGRLSAPIIWWEWLNPKNTYAHADEKFLLLELEAFINHLERFG